MRTSFLLPGLFLAFLSGPSAQAQVMIDATRITCDQFVHDKIGPRRNLAAWLSGFYNGKKNNAVIDMQKFEQNLSKLEQYCYEGKNSNILVMQAIEKVIGSAK